MFERIRRLFRKASQTGSVVFGANPNAMWMKNNAEAYAKEGYGKNVIAYQAIKKTAEAAANIGILLFNGKDEVVEHPALNLLKRPNLIQSGDEFIKAHVGFYRIAGNAYMERVVANGTPRELYSLRPDRMKVIPGVNGFPKGYVYKAGQNAVAWDWEDGEADILHFREFNPLDDWYGMSPVQPGAYAIDQHNQTMEWIQSLLQNGTMPSGALEMEKEGGLTDDQYDRLKAQIEEQYAGAKNAGRPMLLEGGLKWTQMGLSPDQMSAIENKYASARDISLALGAPPLLLNIPGDSTYSNYKEARLAFFEETVIPLMDAVIDGMNTWLMPMYGDRFQLKLDYDSIPAIAEKRQQMWSMADQSNDLTINEKRQIKGYEPVDGGDAVMMPANLIPLMIEDAGENGEMGQVAEDVQAAALNGAQLSSLQQIVQAVADGLLPADSAIQLIMIGFPRLTREEAEAIISPATGFVPVSNEAIKALAYGPDSRG